jgi:hypothetical protein
MESVNVLETKTNVAKLVSYQERHTRPLGFVKGNLPESFFDALPEEELGKWEL